MKVPSTPDGTSKFDLTYFYRQWARLAQVINGNLSLGLPTDPSASNLEGTWFTGTTPVAPNTDFNVPHQLGRVPTGFIMVSLDQPAVVYKGAAQWTPSLITLKCNTASVNVVLLVV